MAGNSTDGDAARDETIAQTQATPGAGVDADRLQRGTLLGRYIVIERLGAGGMGVVYAALDPELGRQIALKLVRWTSDASMGDTQHASSGAVRLLREAQAMARLHHPNVIAVHDVGTVDATPSRPAVFIAMEYLDGGTLGAWLDRERPAWTAVLPRFVAAGRGLAAAHAAGIVHRDFKADNVLLGKDGRVCVVDFGLARAANELGHTRSDDLARSGTDSFDTKLTRTGALMGTPAYMAPEQHAGSIADARSDQFAFCVALYEALYFQRPFGGDNVATLAANVLDGALRPPPVGTAVPRWLYAVITRGLAVMPQARFADMNALLAALADDPTARRHRRWRQGATAALVIGGATLALAYSQQRAEVCTHAQATFDAVWSPEARGQARAAFSGVERAHAAQAWRQAELELDDYATQWIDAHTEACRATSVRGEQSEDMLDRRMSCLDERLHQVESVVAMLVTADAKVVDHATRVLGQIESVGACSDTAALLDAAALPVPADRAEADDLRTQLARAKVLRTAGRYDAAREAVTAIEYRVEALAHSPTTAEFLYMRAATALDHGRPADAEADLWAAALAAAEADYESLEPLIWTSLVRAVGTHADRPLELPPLVRTAEVAVARAGNSLAARGSLAVVVGTQALQRGEYSAAEERLQHAVTWLGEAWGVDHPDTLEAREMLALTYHGRKRYDEAEAALTELAAAIERTRGATHPSLASVLANLSRIHAARGELELARTSGERALAAIGSAYGPNHQVTATGHVNLATTLRKLERYDEAKQHLDAALEIETHSFGAESPRIASTTHSRAQVSMARGRPLEALADYREASRIWEATLGPDDPSNAYALTGIGEAELALGNTDAAIAALERAVALREAAKDVGIDDLADTRFVLARALRAASRDQVRAVELARKAREVFVQLEALDAVSDVDAWLATMP